jgi:hypothetical protein
MPRLTTPTITERMKAGRRIAETNEALASSVGSAPRVECRFCEDEMIVLHRGGEFAATLYATCPEQAQDFVRDYGRCTHPTVEQWEVTLANFKLGWKSKYTDED